jgi:hypothetical protein
MKAETGYNARGGPYPGNNSQNGPYNHYYGYDEFNHLTSRTGHYWYRESGENYTASYQNNRNQNTGWLYDADGRMTQSQVITRTSSPNSVTQTYTYDAAGQRTDAGKYDGDGRRVQAADAKRYDLRSSLLGGRSVTEIYAETDPEALRRGRKATTFVYVEGEPIAEQSVSYVSGAPVEDVRWTRRDPAGTSVYSYDGVSTSQRALDVQGVATEAPDYARLQQNQSYYTQHYSSYNYGGSSSGYSASAGGGMPGNFGSGCTVNGAPWDCNSAMRVGTQCPNNDCGPRYNAGGYAPGQQGTRPAALSSLAHKLVTEGKDM